jgi:hypothetical protein
VYAGESGVSTETVDEASIAAFGERLGAVDNVVSTASVQGKADYFAGMAARNPARRIDGGEPLT